MHGTDGAPRGARAERRQRMKAAESRWDHIRKEYDEMDGEECENIRFHGRFPPFTSLQSELHRSRSTYDEITGLHLLVDLQQAESIQGEPDAYPLLAQAILSLEHPDEIEWAVGRQTPVHKINRIDGELIRPQEIVDTIRKAVQS